MVLPFSVWGVKCISLQLFASLSCFQVIFLFYVSLDVKAEIPMLSYDNWIEPDPKFTKLVSVIHVISPKYEPSAV